MSYQITLHGDVVGHYWWPIGEEWIKEGASFDVTAYQRRCVNGGRGDRGISLWEAVEAFTSEHDGDSSSGCTLREAYLEITSIKGNRRRSRIWMLDTFPTADDFLDRAFV